MLSLMITKNELISNLKTKQKEGNLRLTISYAVILLNNKTKKKRNYFLMKIPDLLEAEQRMWAMICTTWSTRTRGELTPLELSRSRSAPFVADAAAVDAANEAAADDDDGVVVVAAVESDSTGSGELDCSRVDWSRCSDWAVRGEVRMASMTMRRRTMKTTMRRRKKRMRMRSWMARGRAHLRRQSDSNFDWNWAADCLAVSSTTATTTMATRMSTMLTCWLSASLNSCCCCSDIEIWESCAVSSLPHPHCCPRHRCCSLSCAWASSTCHKHSCLRFFAHLSRPLCAHSSSYPSSHSSLHPPPLSAYYSRRRSNRSPRHSRHHSPHCYCCCCCCYCCQSSIRSICSNCSSFVRCSRRHSCASRTQWHHP